MEELSALARSVKSGLRALQRAQRVYDSDMWDIAEPRFANQRHIHIHLSITVGKLARLIEPQDHRVHSGESAEAIPQSELAPIIADLLIHAAQLANIDDADLGEVLAERYRSNASRFARDSVIRTFGD